jgi:predicted lipoprotein with Yx(FWY)xxD motif
VKNSLTLAIAATALILLAGCGSTSSTTSSSAGAASTASKAATPAPRYAAPGSSTASTAAASSSAAFGMLITSKHDKLGTVLAAGPKKMTVYLFEADKGGASACSGACAAAWPPVTTSGSPKSAAGAVAADLGTIKRADGSMQVTYKGHPLYYFVKDKDAGDAYGQGSSAFGASWYTLAPDGKKVDRS